MTNRFNPSSLDRLQQSNHARGLASDWVNPQEPRMRNWNIYSTPLVAGPEPRTRAICKFDKKKKPVKISVIDVRDIVREVWGVDCISGFIKEFVNLLLPDDRDIEELLVSPNWTEVTLKNDPFLPVHYLYVLETFSLLGTSAGTFSLGYRHFLFDCHTCFSTKNFQQDTESILETSLANNRRLLIRNQKDNMELAIYVKSCKFIKGEDAILVSRKVYSPQLIEMVDLCQCLVRSIMLGFRVLADKLQKIPVREVESDWVIKIYQGTGTKIPELINEYKSLQKLHNMLCYWRLNAQANQGRCLTRAGWKNSRAV